jgi:dephospho-CoA kinase
MQDIGNRLRAEGGAGVLGRLVREQVLASAAERWVIDGIRNPAEVLELKKISGFFLVGIDSDIPAILARMKRRGRATDAIAEAELRAALEREWGRGEPADGQQVGPTLAMADFTVANNGTLAELQARLDEVLEKIGAGHE